MAEGRRDGEEEDPNNIVLTSLSLTAAKTTTETQLSQSIFDHFHNFRNSLRVTDEEKIPK